MGKWRSERHIFVNEELEWFDQKKDGTILLLISGGYTEEHITRYVQWYFTVFTTFDEQKVYTEKNEERIRHIAYLKTEIGKGESVVAYREAARKFNESVVMGN